MTGVIDTLGLNFVNLMMIVIIIIIIIVIKPPLVWFIG